MSKAVSRRTFIQTGTGLITAAWGGLRIFAGPGISLRSSPQRERASALKPARRNSSMERNFFGRPILPAPCAMTC